MVYLVTMTFLSEGEKKDEITASRGRDAQNTSMTSQRGTKWHTKRVKAKVEDIYMRKRIYDLLQIHMSHWSFLALILKHCVSG